jgi:DNA helicase HerA-like ATPase
VKKLITIRIEPEIWEEFRRKYEKVGLSSKVRELILKELNGASNEVMIKKLDWKSLYKIVFVDDLPIQVVGNVGIGKSLTVKELIKNDKSHIYIVFDAHNEYDFLPEIQMISQEIKQSSRIVLPKQVSASIGLFPLFSNQLLTQKWNDNFVFVVEEAHRYPESKLLLKEARKFCKLIIISQEPLVDFCPVVRVIS